MFFGGENPFEAGMPDGMGSASRKDVDTTKLYETLGVETKATKKEIRKAYMTLSRTHHPDKGGDEQTFKEISAAYEILSDEEKRAQYDQYGLEGVSGDDARSDRGEDLFGTFFGFGGRKRRAGPRKGPSINHSLEVSLEDLYSGKRKKMAINRKIILGTPTECSDCKGQGSISEVREVAPGMLTQTQRVCGACRGQGQQCTYTSERKVVEVYIEKGANHGDKITFRGMSDEVPNMEKGDVNFVIQAKDHELFKRKGADLLVVKEVSLNQALCGFTYKINHLDGRVLVVTSRPGEVIKPEMSTKSTLPFVKVVDGEGFPSKGNPFAKGDLYIMFRVKFPEDHQLSLEATAKLKALLPEADEPEEYDPMDVEEVEMKGGDFRSFGKGGANHFGSESYNSDDEEGAQPVQCQQS